MKYRRLTKSDIIRRTDQYRIIGDVWEDQGDSFGTGMHAGSFMAYKFRRPLKEKVESHD